MPVRFLRHLSGTPIGPRHRIVVATATTIDGVIAHLQASCLLTVTDTLAAEAQAAIEARLRHLISTRTVADLPIAGESVELDVHLDGVRIEHLTVESADVVVSPELRRLVRHGA